MKTIHVLSPGGRVPYRRGLEWQREAARRRIDGDLEGDVLALLEHDPVLTLGRNADAAHVTADREALERLGVDRVEVERGGDVTYHGPGQLVGYPIFDLRDHRKDLHWFLRRIEEALIATLSAFGVEGFRVEGHTGVWVGEPDGAVSAETAAPLVAAGRVRKVASIGIHVSRWVSWHGFALNVTREPLRSFRLIVPCGIQGVRMTSLAAEGVDAGVDEVRGAAAEGFASAFGARAAAATDAIREALPPLPPEAADAGPPDAADGPAVTRETGGGGAGAEARPAASGPERDGSEHAGRSVPR